MNESYRVVPSSTHESYRVSESYRPYRADSLSQSTRYESYPNSDDNPKELAEPKMSEQRQLFETKRVRQRLIVHRTKAEDFRHKVGAVMDFYRQSKPNWKTESK